MDFDPRTVELDARDAFESKCNNRLGLVDWYVRCWLNGPGIGPRNQRLHHTVELLHPLIHIAHVRLGFQCLVLVYDELRSSYDGLLRL